MKVYILFIAIGVSLACDCPDQTDEQIYCGADFVLKVEVKDEAEVGDAYQYNVDIKTEYRATDEIDNAKKIVQTMKDADKCGIRLDAGNVYFLTGHFEQAADGSTVLGVGACEVVGATSDARVQDILKADLSCGKRSTEEMVLRSLLRRVASEDAQNEYRQRKAVL